MQVGDLVRMPPSSGCWWGGEVGIIDLIEVKRNGCCREYRVLVSPNRYVRFSETSFVELINEV